MIDSPKDILMEKIAKAAAEIANDDDRIPFEIKNSLGDIFWPSTTENGIALEYDSRTIMGHLLALDRKTDIDTLFEQIIHEAAHQAIFDQAGDIAAQILSNAQSGQGISL
jgi:hypothetical protein